MINALLMGVIGIIINYLVINFGIPLAFPVVYKFSKMKNRLNVSNVSIPLTMGSCNFDSSNTEINTSNPFKDGFVFMPNSNNLKGGSQFSYSFWLDIKSTYANQLSNVNIFMRGNKNLNKGLLKDLVNNKNKYPLTVCPLVKFADFQHNDKKHLLDIVFNTAKNPHTVVSIDGDAYNKITSSNSNPRWFLITIVIQDYIDFTNSEKGIQIQNFINDNLVSTKVIKNDSLKLNNGNVYLTPNDTLGDEDRGSSFYSDLTYYNYALDIIDIQKIYDMGITENSTGCVTAKYTSNDKTDYYHTLGMSSYI